MYSYKIHKLSNGLSVILVNCPNFNSVYFDLAVKAGLRNENKETNGLSHLVEHIVYRKILDKLKYSKWIKKYPHQDFHAYTGINRTNYELYVVKDDIKMALELLSQSLDWQNIQNKNIFLEKKIIGEEILEDKTDPDCKFNKFLRSKFYSNNPLKYRILGNEKNLVRFGRKDVADFMKKFYQPQNIILTVAGDFKSKEVLRLTNKYFLSSINSEQKKYNIKKFQYVGDNLYFTDRRDDQILFSCFFGVMGDDSVENIKKEFVIELLRDYLIYTIREKGLCYTLDVDSSPFEEFSEVYISAYFQPYKAVSFYNQLKKAFKSFKEDITAKDLNFLKKNKINNIDLDSDFPRLSANNLSWYQLTFEKAISFEEQKKVINSITLPQVNHYFNILFSGRGNVFFGGQLDKKSQDRIRKIWQK